MFLVHNDIVCFCLNNIQGTLMECPETNNDDCLNGEGNPVCDLVCWTGGCLS